MNAKLVLRALCWICRTTIHFVCTLRMQRFESERAPRQLTTTKTPLRYFSTTVVCTDNLCTQQGSSKCETLQLVRVVESFHSKLRATSNAALSWTAGHVVSYPLQLEGWTFMALPKALGSWISRTAHLRVLQYSMIVVFALGGRFYESDRLAYTMFRPCLLCENKLIQRDYATVVYICVIFDSSFRATK